MESLELSGHGDENQVMMPKRRRGRKAAHVVVDRPRLEAQSKIAWQDVADFRVLRDPGALYEEFLMRKAEDDPKRIAALLYAAMKFPEHPEAAEMLNCCAYNRWISARSTSHLVQSLRGFEQALRVVKVREDKWKIGINRAGLYNYIGTPKTSLRNAGWLLAEIPPAHPLYGYLCYGMGGSYMLLGQYALAADALGRAARTPNLSVDLHDKRHMSWARALLRSQESVMAKEALSRVNNRSAATFLAVEAEFLYVEQDWVVFLKLAKAALRVYPAQAAWSFDRWAVAELHRQMARAYIAVGERELAEKHLTAGQVIGASFGMGGLND